MIANISYQMDSFDEISAAIERCLQNPQEKQKVRRAANKILFLALDGRAGERAAENIIKMMDE